MAQKRRFLFWPLLCVALLCGPSCASFSRGFERTYVRPAPTYPVDRAGNPTDPNAGAQQPAAPAAPAHHPRRVR